MIRRTFLVAFLVGLPAALAGAQSAYEQQVRRYLSEARDYALGEGYVEAESVRVASLNASTGEDQWFTLGGGGYMFIGVCDDDCSDIDAVLFDEAGNQIDIDNADDDVPVLTLETTGGRYRVSVQMFGCANEPCYYGIGSYRFAGADDEDVVDARPEGVHARPPGEAQVLLDTWNRASVSDGPSTMLDFEIREPFYLTEITNYHWNGGRGAAGGSISLRDSHGAVYGPWSVRTTSGTNDAPDVNWIAAPNEVIPPGRYEVLDSDPSTWSHNRRSGSRGFSNIQGIRVRR